jgi:WS/DGAT/MGAT family acyltransferase
MVDSRSRFENALLKFETEATPQVMAALCWLDRPPDLVALLEHLRAAVVRFPRLGECVVRAPRLKWMASPEFRLEQHVECVDLPQAETKDELLDEIGRQFSRKLDPHQPRWRVVVLRGRPTRDLDPAPATPACILFLMHHTYADGIRALGIVEALAGEGPDPMPPSEAASGPRRYRPTATRLGKFWQGIKAVGKMCVGHLTSRGESCLNGKPSPERRVLLADFERNALRPVMRRFRCSVQAVLLAGVAGALRAYHRVRDRPVHDLRILATVSTHLEPTSNSLGNYLAAFPLPLPLAEPYPAKRLLRVRDALERSRSDGSLSISAIGLAVLEWAPRWLRPPMVAEMARQHCLMSTLVPGPRKVQQLASARVEAIYGLPPHHGDQGVSITFVTYGRAVHAAIVADPQVIPNPEPLLVCLREGVKEIVACAADGTGVSS